VLEHRGVVVVVAALALVPASWAVAVAMARRLPPGLLRDVAAFLPACVTAARRLRGRPEVPLRAKLALAVAVLWVISPIDLIPEFLPVIGPLDDVVAVVLLLRYAARSVPRPVLLEAWPEDPALLERVLDGRRAAHPPEVHAGPHTFGKEAGMSDQNPTTREDPDDVEAHLARRLAGEEPAEREEVEGHLAKRFAEAEGDDQGS
jgi:uncharacterized membrane protein YkvA (DUF1232 family)